MNPILGIMTYVEVPAEEDDDPEWPADWNELFQLQEFGAYQEVTVCSPSRTKGIARILKNKGLDWFKTQIIELCEDEDTCTTSKASVDAR